MNNSPYLILYYWPIQEECHVFLWCIIRPTECLGWQRFKQTILFRLTDRLSRLKNYTCIVDQSLQSTFPKRKNRLKVLVAILLFLSSVKISLSFLPSIVYWVITILLKFPTRHKPCKINGEIPRTQRLTRANKNPRICSPHTNSRKNLCFYS